MYSLQNAVSLTVSKVKNPTREKLKKETGDLKERLNNEIAETKVNEGRGQYCVETPWNIEQVNFVFFYRPTGINFKPQSMRMPAKEKMKLIN